MDNAKLRELLATLQEFKIESFKTPEIELRFYETGYFKEIQEAKPEVDQEELFLKWIEEQKAQALKGIEV